MLKKSGSILLGLSLVLLLSLPAGAACDGSICVSLDAGELPVTNGCLTLYYVGKTAEEGYRLTDVFGGGLVRREDADSASLAQWLADAAGDTGKTINLDVEGDVIFSGLEDGLYLVVQTQRMDGFHPIAPMLVQLSPEQGRQRWLAPQTYPIIADNPQTGDPMTALWGAMGLVVSGVGLYLCFDSRRKK